MPPKSRFKLPPLTLDQDHPEESLGQRLARLRKERGFTQVELAKKVGIIQVLVSDYERDRIRMHAEIVARFALALDISSDELLGLSESSAAGHKKVGRLSLKIVRRLQRIERLPDPQQKRLLQSIDLLLDGSAQQGS